jgi:hypothetical protein
MHDPGECISAEHVNYWRLKARYILLVTLLCLAFLASCVYPSPVSTAPSQASLPSATPAKLPDSTSTPYITTPPTPAQPEPIVSVSPEPTAQNTSPTPVSTDAVPTQYDLDAVLDYFAHSLTISETIGYVNSAVEAIPVLSLVVEANRWPGSFALLSISWADGSINEGYDLQDAKLNIPLLRPLRPGEKLGLKLAYHLDLPEIPPPSDVARPVPYGYSGKQTNIVDWYPYVPPCVPGTGWLVHPKWGFGEHQVFDTADFDVKLSLVEPVPDLVVAASAPAESNGGSYHYHLESARSFAISASTDYVLKTATVGDVTINSYFFTYDQKAGEQVLRDTTAALELYSRLFLPYPHASLSVVEADFLDGMEYDGLFFLSRGFYNLYDGTPQGYLTFIAAHETAHQWFYGIVGNDQALEPWLDEAMCTYMEHIFYENVYADYATTTGESIVDWWWYYRVNFYNPTGWVDSSIYDFNLFRPYRDAIYLNGAKFLQDLRTVIGDEAFFAFLKDYTSHEAGQIATADEFFAVLRNHTSKNLDNIFASYFQDAK